MDPERLTDFRNTPWTTKGWLIWERGDSIERKQDVWREHKRCGLDETLTKLIQQLGPPSAVAIRRRQS